MRWLLTLFAALARWRIRRAHSGADKWIARQEWAEARLQQLTKARRK